MLNLENLIFKQLPNYVFWKDKNSIYLGCNTPFAKIAGLNEASEIVGKTDFDLPWANTGASRYVKDDRQACEGLSLLNYYETLLIENGSVLSLSVCKVPLRDTKDKIIGVLGTSSVQNIEPFGQPKVISLAMKAKDSENKLSLYLNERLGNTLTHREIESLSLWIGGVSIKQAARIMEISTRTVEKYRCSIKLKMKLNNRQSIIEFIHSHGAFELFLHLSSLLQERISSIKQLRGF